MYLDLKNAECEFDAIVGVGDIAENGLLEEYQLAYNELAPVKYKNVGREFEGAKYIDKK